MSDGQGHIGINLAIWGVFTGSGVLAAAVELTPPWFVWTPGLAFSLLWLVAILGLSDEASRKFLAGTLRKSSFTQIYTALTRRNVIWLWGKLCDPAGDRDGWPTLFRAALTWRLYDTALLLAVVYPLALLTAQWILTGEDGRVGTALVLPAAAFWPERAAVLGAYVLLLAGAIARKLASASRHRVVRQAADWLLIGAFAFAFAVAFVGAVAGAFAVAGAVAVMYLVEKLEDAGKQPLALGLVTGAAVLMVCILVPVLDWSAISEDLRSLFLFLGVFPLLNALFDVISYAVTLSLLRRGLRAGWPFVWGLLDLLLACALFLALGATLVVVIHGLNSLAGVPLLDLGALFAGVKETPGQYVWLYLMLFSTILPTALHFVVSLTGVQGLWPRVWRRPVAGWVDHAGETPVQAVRAGVALGVIWTLPLIGSGVILWGLWAFGGGLVMAALSRYFDILLWIAAVPIGAF